MPEVRALGTGTERPRALAVGVGGAGCNTLRVLPPTPDLDVLAVNDLPQPSMVGIKRRLFLEKAGLQGIAAMDERSVKTLATTAEQAVALELGAAELVFPLAGLGGEMGSWGASLVARVAALKGAAVLAVVNTPFSAEGVNRQSVAAEGLRVLRTHAHGVLAVPNDPLLRVAPHLPLLKAFDVISRLAVQAIRDFVQVATRADLDSLKAVLRNASEWHLGIGEGTRDHPELAAVDAAFRSPWITRPTDGAREVLLLIATPEPDERAVQSIIRDVDLRAPRASVTWGAFTEPGDAIRVTALVGF